MRPDELWALLGGGRNDFHAFRFPDSTVWVATSDRDRFVRICRGAETVRVSACPHWERSWRLPSNAHMLWAVAETPATRLALEGFKPAPTFMVTAGGVLTAGWALSQGLGPAWTERLNKRIAHRTGCKKKWAGCGTMFELGTVAGWTGELHSARAVAGRLRDAPDPDAWRQKAA